MTFAEKKCPTNFSKITWVATFSEDIEAFNMVKRIWRQCVFFTTLTDELVANVLLDIIGLSMWLLWEIKCRR